MVSARFGKGKAPNREIKAMILNISLDGALIETAEQLTCRSLVLANTYKDESVAIHAKVIHHQNVNDEDRVFGPFRSGLHFMNNIDAAKEFIISIVKSQEKEADEFIKDQGITPEWMDTGQINLALFSTDSYDEDDLELPDVLEPLSERSSWVEQEAADKKKPPETKPAAPPEAPKPVAEKVPPPVTFRPPINKPPLYEPPPPATQEREDRRGLTIGHIISGLAFIALLVSLMIFRSPVNDGSSASSFWEKLGIDIPFINERPVLPQGDSPDIAPVESDLPAHLLKDSIKGSMVYNDKLGPLFVIRGYLTLQTGHRLEEINVRGKIFDKNKELITSMTTWPGNQLNDDQITLLDSNDLLKVTNFSPNKGFYQRVPFIMVFSDLPRETRSFSVDLTFIEL